MALLPHASWGKDAIHDLEYHRLLLTFKEPAVQQSYLEDRTRRYRWVRTKLHAGFCVYLALFTGHAASAHVFHSVFAVFGIFFAVANLGICFVLFCTNYFVSHRRLSHVTHFVALTVLVCSVLWLATDQHQYNVVYAVSSPVVLALFNIASRTSFFRNFACLIALSAMSTAGLAVHGVHPIVVFEAVATFVMLGMMVYEVEHIALQDFMAMHATDTQARRPSGLGPRSSRGESVLEADALQAIHSLMQAIMSSLKTTIADDRARNFFAFKKPRPQDLWMSTDYSATHTASAPSDYLRSSCEQQQNLSQIAVDSDESQAENRPPSEGSASPAAALRTAAGESVAKSLFASTTLSSFDITQRPHLEERMRSHSLVRTNEMCMAMVHYLRAVRGRHVAGTERLTFSLYELCEKLISLLELCDGRRRTIYNEVPPALMLTGSRSQLQSILLLLLSDAAEDQQAFVNVYAKQVASDGHAWRVGVQVLKVVPPTQSLHTLFKEADSQSEMLPAIKTMTKVVLHSKLMCERVAGGMIHGYKRHFGLSSTFLSFTSSVSMPLAASPSAFPVLLNRSWIVIEAENLRQMSNIKQCLTQLGVTWTTCSADMLKSQTRATQAALVPATLFQHPISKKTIESYAKATDQAFVAVMNDSLSSADVLLLLDDFPVSGLLFENCPVKEVAEVVLKVTHQRGTFQHST